MHFVCISASNIRHARENGTSVKVCQLIQQLLIEKYSEDLTVDIIALVDYDLKPCCGCGACFKLSQCSFDPEFNKLYARLIKGDGLFIVSAHYAPIPAKLCMLLEKVEQFTFLPRFSDEEYRSPLYKRPVGLIGHGGGMVNLIQWYKEPVLGSIANALSWPVEMKIIGLDEMNPNGVVFPVKDVQKVKDETFPIQIYDWIDIRNRIRPLVEKVVGEIILNRNIQI